MTSAIAGSLQGITVKCTIVSDLKNEKKKMEKEKGRGEGDCFQVNKPSLTVTTAVVVCRLYARAAERSLLLQSSDCSSVQLSCRPSRVESRHRSTPLLFLFLFNSTTVSSNGDKAKRLPSTIEPSAVAACWTTLQKLQC